MKDYWHQKNRDITQRGQLLVTSKNIGDPPLPKGQLWGPAVGWICDFWKDAQSVSYKQKLDEIKNNVWERSENT